MPETITSSSCIVGTFEEIYLFLHFFETLSDKVIGILRRYLIHLKLLHLFVQASVEQVDEVEELGAENIHGCQLISHHNDITIGHIRVIKAVAIVNMALFKINIIIISMIMITMTTTILIINNNSPL